MDFRTFIESITYHSDGSVTISNIDAISPKSWHTINNYMRRKGYAGADNKQLIGTIIQRSGGKLNANLWPDHAAAVRYAIRPAGPERTTDEKLLTKIKRYFGLTGNWMVAGYILPDGSMLDFSGRKRSSGGEVFSNRGDDHRFIGQFFDVSGYEAIREMGERFGGISVSGSADYASFRIYKVPSDKQMNIIKQIAREVPDIQLNMYLGRQSFDHMYHTKVEHNYLVDIRRFYGG